MDLRKNLLPEEQADFDKHERTIEKGLKTFYAVGEALETIRVHRLYRATHDKFEDYCRDRWGIGEQRSRQMRSAAKVVKDIEDHSKNRTMVLVAPDNERQVRPLAALSEPEKRAEAWENAVQAAGGAQPTSRQVAEAARPMLPTPAPRPPRPLPITRVQLDQDFPDDLPVREIDDDADFQEGEEETGESDQVAGPMQRLSQHIDSLERRIKSMLPVVSAARAVVLELTIETGWESRCTETERRLVAATRLLEL